MGKPRSGGPSNTEALSVALSKSQHGVISRSQARSIGLSAQQVRYRLKTDQWKMLDSDAFLIGAGESCLTSIMAACLGLDGVASHRTAGWLWGLLGEPQAIEITIRRSRYRRRRGVMIYSTTRFDSTGVTRLNQIPTTGIDRTAVDLATVLSPSDLDTMLRRILQRELSTLDRLFVALDEQAGKGRPGITMFRSALQALA